MCKNLQNKLTSAVKMVCDGVQEGVLWRQEAFHHGHLGGEVAFADSQETLPNGWSIIPKEERKQKPTIPLLRFLLFPLIWAVMKSHAGIFCFLFGENLSFLNSSFPVWSQELWVSAVHPSAPERDWNLLSLTMLLSISKSLPLSLSVFPIKAWTIPLFFWHAANVSVISLSLCASSLSLPGEVFFHHFCLFSSTQTSNWKANGVRAVAASHRWPFCESLPPLCWKTHLLLWTSETWRTTLCARRRSFSFFFPSLDKLRSEVKLCRDDDDVQGG